jgi:hypothetical protein
VFLAILGCSPKFRSSVPNCAKLGPRLSGASWLATNDWTVFQTPTDRSAPRAREKSREGDRCLPAASGGLRRGRVAYSPDGVAEWLAKRRYQNTAASAVAN